MAGLVARIIRGLQSAALATNPWGKTPRAGAGPKGRGIRFERAIAKMLPSALHGQWFRFVDNAGPGYCQPDLLFARGDCLFVVECKLTDCSEAWDQLDLLYTPVLRMLWEGEIRPIVVARYLSPITPRERVVTTWDEAMARPKGVLHAFALTPPSAAITPPEWKTHCAALA